MRSLEFKVLMPNELCGALIGNKGKAINRLRDRHSIDISVDQRYKDRKSNQDAKTRRVIFGPSSPSNLRACIRDSFEVLMEAPVPDAKRYKEIHHGFTILLTSSEMGALIGRHGSRINSIRDKTGVKLKVAKDRDDESGVADISGARLCKIRDAFDMLIEAITSDAGVVLSKNTRTRSISRRRHSDRSPPSKRHVENHRGRTPPRPSDKGVTLLKNGRTRSISRTRRTTDRSPPPSKKRDHRGHDDGNPVVPASKRTPPKRTRSTRSPPLGGYRGDGDGGSPPRKRTTTEKKDRSKSPDHRSRSQSRSKSPLKLVERARNHSETRSLPRDGEGDKKNGKSPPPPVLRAKKEKKKSKSRSPSESGSRSRKSGSDHKSRHSGSASRSRSQSPANAYLPLVCSLIIPRAADLTTEQLHDYAETSKAQIIRTKDGVQVAGTPTQVQVSVTLLCRGLQECGVVFAPAQ